MTIDVLQGICQTLPAVTQDLKWDNHLCFNVGGKMFMITSPDEVPVSASIKVSDEDFDELADKDGFMPAPYLARYKWIFVDNIARLSPKQWQHYIANAHRLVAKKLPQRVKKELGIANWLRDREE